MRGPTKCTSAPSFVNPMISLLATRECNTSPMMTYFIPLIFFPASFIVKSSRSAWLGCACAPSPAFSTTGTFTFGLMTLDAKRAAPSDESRITTASTPIAETVSNVSRILSPFVIELPLFVMLITSAPKYLPASSKELRVLVDASENTVTIDLPFRKSFFLLSDNTIFFICAATSKIRSISSAVKSASPRTLRPCSEIVLMPASLNQRIEWDSMINSYPYNHKG